MSLFGAVAREFKGTAGLTWGQINELWAGLLGGGYQSKSGIPVGWKTALRVSTFLACTRRIAEAVSTVPTKVYQKSRGEKRREAYDHPLYELLDSEPNEWQDPLQFKETLAVHCAVTNNAYAFKNRVRSKLVELIPLIPTHVQPKWAADRTPYYIVTAPDGTPAYPRLVLGRALRPRRGATAAGAARSGARNRADPCNAARPRRPPERHRVGRKKSR